MVLFGIRTLSYSYVIYNEHIPTHSPLIHFPNTLLWLAMAFCVSMRKYKGTIARVRPVILG